MKTLEQIANDLNLQGAAITEDFAIMYNHGLYNDIKPMKTQHTPSPWNYSASHPRITKHVFGGYIIPDVCEVETEENARLIAAAPELLASETQFVQLCNNLAVALTEDQITEAIRELTSHCHAARAVISKATGGQS